VARFNALNACGRLGRTGRPGSRLTLNRIDVSPGFLRGWFGERESDETGPPSRDGGPGHQSNGISDGGPSRDPVVKGAGTVVSLEA